MKEDSTEDLVILDIGVVSNGKTTELTTIKENQIAPNKLSDAVLIAGIVIKTKLMEIVCKNFVANGDKVDKMEITVFVKRNDRAVMEKTREVKKNSDFNQIIGSISKEVMIELPYYISESKEFRAL